MKNFEAFGKKYFIFIAHKPISAEECIKRKYSLKAFYNLMILFKIEY